MYQPFLKKYLESIKNSNTFLISGDEDYFRYHSKKYLLNKFSEFPITNMESPSTEEIFSELCTSDLFSEQKILLIEDFSPLTSVGKKIDDEEVKNLTKYIGESEHIVIFFFNNDVDKRKKVTKEIINISHHIECKKIVKKEIVKFLEYLTSKYKLNISQSVLNDLSIYIGETDLMLIEKEFEKLSLFDDSININNIYDIISIPTQQKVFDLMSKIVERNLDKALEIYETLLFNRESEYKIYSFLSSQFTHMLKIKMIRQDGVLLDIPKTLSIHPFMADQLEKYNKNFTLENLCNIQNVLLETDVKIKQGLTNSVNSVKFLIMYISTL